MSVRATMTTRLVHCLTTPNWLTISYLLTILTVAVAEASVGLIPRMARDLFERVAAVEAEYNAMPLPTSIKSVRVEAAFFEIYNEELLVC